MTCAVCGQPLPDGARFCPNCGAPVSTSLGTEERKLVTVMFADLVDSTGLAQRLDPERTREVLGRFYDEATEEILALRGRPEKFIGDAVMAVFGLPQVHEDDAVRAVRAGLAMRDRVRRMCTVLGLPQELEVRVGIETGEAATGVGPSGQLLVTGPVVNAAARLEAAAEPGQVVAGDTTHQLTQGAVSFEDRRVVPAKGFSEGLIAYPVLELTTRSTRRTIPVVGRASELAILRDSYARVVSADRPILVTLLGEPGVGKSRLVDEFVAGLDPDVLVLNGRSRSSSDSATFAPVAAMVRDLAGLDDGEASEGSVKMIQALAERCCDPVEATHVAERLALTLGIGEPRRDESAFVQEVQGGFLTLAEGLAADAPLVLVFDDAHALRPAMLDLVERLAARSAHRPGAAMIVAVARPELADARPSWGSTAHNHTVIRLVALPPEEAVELARESSGGRVDAATAAQIADRTGGNPFFIVEITGMLLRGDHGGGPDGAIPPTVQSVVAARLDHLLPPLRDLTRQVSVFLYNFDPVELAYIGVDADRLPDLESLLDEEVLVRVDGSESRWRFRHEMLRDVAYASLPKRERVRLHLAIVDGIRDAKHEHDHVTYAADHLERAASASLDLAPDDRTIPERAVDALAAAGDRSRRRMESRSAVDFYQRAIAMAGPDDAWGTREARLLAGMGEARYWLGEYPAAIEVLDRALEVDANDAWTVALALRFRGDIALNFEGDLNLAASLFDRSLAAAERLGDPFAIDRTLLFAGWVPWSREDYEEAGRLWKRALMLSKEHSDPWARARALTALSINRSDQGDHDEAVRLIDEAETVASELGDQFSTAVASVQRGRLHQDSGEHHEAIARYDRAIETFSELGARWELADATAERGIAYRELGQLDRAEADLRRAIQISEELGERTLARWSWRALARVSEKRGDGAEARERFRRAEEEEARKPR
jgi:class 3 adenylate cyclase/tetratricopeptide (TPR) repeat protein